MAEASLVNTFSSAYFNAKKNSPLNHDNGLAGSLYRHKIISNLSYSNRKQTSTYILPSKIRPTRGTLEPRSINETMWSECYAASHHVLISRDG